MSKYSILFFLIAISSACKDKHAATTTQDTFKKHWWKEAIVYQIYPRSFQDTDGDGVGDLKGIISKLDYIQSLGVTAVWLNPIYSSPNEDNGYDVSDYRNIMADFGTMADFDLLLQGLHSRGIKLIMDVVVNHSSDEHEWFKQSRRSRDNPYRQYYHWWPAEKGKPNYRYSLFDERGDAWKYDSTTNSYYLHYFSSKQPDLNWENPALRQEVYDIMKFWAKKGVDGFRLDAFQFAAKDTSYPAYPTGYEKNFMQYYAMQGHIHDYLKEMHKEVFSRYDVMSVAEGAGRNFEDAHQLVDEDRNELNMAYAFEGVDIAKPGGYSILHFKEVFTRWDSAFAHKGWLAVFLSNHDQARLVSRFGDDNPAYREASAKLLNTFILSMRGTPYCYYGDELGMINIGFDSISQYRDIAAINGYKKVQLEHGDLQAYLKDLKFSSRDNGRTPMQWDSSAQAHFTSGIPWLPIHKNHVELNVAAQEKNKNSVLNYFKTMIQLRKNNAVLVYGDYKVLQPEHPEIYAYTRSLGNRTMLILLNFSNQPSRIVLNELAGQAKVEINNYSTAEISGKQIVLFPYQSVIFSIQ